MLTLMVEMSDEQYDEQSNAFVSDGFALRLEHSLVSLSKWESIFCKPFLGSDKTPEETLCYIEEMALDPELPLGIFQKLSTSHVEAINEYINAKMTATTVRDSLNQRPNREIITAEIIYYWMIALSIPFECQYWHLNKLLMLIKVCNAKNQTPKKMGKGEALRRQRELNAQRRQASGSSG